LGCDRITEEENLKSAAGSHDPGEEVGSPHVRPGEADLGEQEVDLDALSGQAQVAGQGNDGPRPGSGPVQGGNDRFFQLTHVEDYLAGHPGELEMALYVALEQGLDNLEDIASRAEGLAATGEDDRFHRLVVA